MQFLVSWVLWMILVAIVLTLVSVALPLDGPQWWKSAHAIFAVIVIPLGLAAVKPVTWR